MKKKNKIILAIIATICILITLLFVCVTSSSSKKIETIKMALLGDRFYSDASSYLESIRFISDGGCYIEADWDVSGVYEVTKDAIIITDEYGNILELTYKYNNANGTLILYLEDGVALIQRNR